MSVDLKLATTCDHIIYWEIGEFDLEDLRSLRVSKPIISSNITVRASGNILPSSTYSLRSDPTSSFAPQKIYFKERRRAIDDVFEIKYNTDLLHCNKCQSLKVLDDIQYNDAGELVQITDEFLLLQNVEKYVITELASNTFHDWVGTSLITLVGMNITDVDYLKTKIINEISTTLNKFKSMQNTQLSTQRPMSDGEILDSILSINVTQDTVDPTIFRVSITVRSRSNKSLTFDQYLKFTGPARQRA